MKKKKAVERSFLKKEVGMLRAKVRELELTQSRDWGTLIALQFDPNHLADKYGIDIE